MNSQIFKKEIHIDIVYDFLKKNCMLINSYFVFTNDAFKKAQYNNSLKEFFNECEPYYHMSKKKKYLANETFNGAVTVLRQIFNFCKVPYSSKIKYAHSSYTIEYFFKETSNIADCK